MYMGKNSIEQKSEWVELYAKDRGELIRLAVSKCNNLRHVANKEDYTVLGTDLITYTFPHTRDWGTEWYLRNVIPEIQKQVEGKFTFETKELMANPSYPNGSTQIIATYHRD